MHVETPGFDTSGGLPLLAMQGFHITTSRVRALVDQLEPDKGWETIDIGMLVHTTNGVRRAVVPPESWDAYAVTWPACGPVIHAARQAFAQRQADARHFKT